MSESAEFLHFPSTKLTMEEMIPAVDATAVNLNVTFEEFLMFFSILKSMEVQRLPERRMYWKIEYNRLFTYLNYGRFMPVYRFETIMANFVS